MICGKTKQKSINNSETRNIRFHAHPHNTVRETRKGDMRSRTMTMTSENFWTPRAPLLFLPNLYSSIPSQTKGPCSLSLNVVLLFASSCETSTRSRQSLVAIVIMPRRVVVVVFQRVRSRFLERERLSFAVRFSHVSRQLRHLG